MLDWILVHVGFLLSFNQQISNICLRLLNLPFDNIRGKTALLHQVDFFQWALEVLLLVFIYPCGYVSHLTGRPFKSQSTLNNSLSVFHLSLECLQAVRFCEVKC